ncbi:hypothetical protein ACOMHN_056280 [Nucella lapillus]
MSAPKNSLFFYSSSASEGRITPVMNSSSEGPMPEGCVIRDLFHFIPWDNEENLVSKEVENIFKLSIYGIAVPLLFVVSFVTNMINMVVFYKHGLKERINACLFTLSLVDLLSVSITYAYSCDIVYMFVIGKGGELGSAAQFFIRNRLMGLWGLVTSSHMVYAVIAVERCLCIARPLLVKSFMSTRTTVAALLTMILTITGVHMFLAGVRYTVKCVFDVEDRSITYASYPSDFYYRHQFIMDLMYSFISGLFLPGLAFLSVTVCTVVTAVKLKKLSRWRESVSSASGSVQSRDLAITRVIIVGMEHPPVVLTPSSRHGTSPVVLTPSSRHGTSPCRVDPIQYAWNIPLSC